MLSNITTHSIISMYKSFILTITVAIISLVSNCNGEVACDLDAENRCQIFCSASKEKYTNVTCLKAGPRSLIWCTGKDVSTVGRVSGFKCTKGTQKACVAFIGETPKISCACKEGEKTKCVI